MNTSFTSCQKRMYGFRRFGTLDFPTLVEPVFLVFGNTALGLLFPPPRPPPEHEQLFGFECFDTRHFAIFDFLLGLLLYVFVS